MKKIRYEISVNSSAQTMGGYLYTTQPMTKTQVYKEMERLGRECMKSNPELTRVSYNAWEEDPEEEKEPEELGHAFILMSRCGRKILITKI